MLSISFFLLIISSYLDNFSEFFNRTAKKIGCHKARFCIKSFRAAFPFSIFPCLPIRLHKKVVSPIRADAQIGELLVQFYLLTAPKPTQHRLAAYPGNGPRDWKTRAGPSDTPMRRTRWSARECPIYPQRNPSDRRCCLLQGSPE